ncbi:MAG: hypothetical protein QXH02_04965 [Desulfurococcaceae archaeon]
MKVHVAVDLAKLHRKLAEEGVVFVTVGKLAEGLSTSTRSAGRILSKMSEKGLVVKYSKTTYKVLLENYVVNARRSARTA